ncbi:MAG TPA: O-antigen ligase family protein, partial [Sulfurovum sp.]|nr:O-antigen ligase family protein [Sulfurovum sp.]
SGYFLVMVLSVTLSNELNNDWIHLSRKILFMTAPFVAIALYQAHIPLKYMLVGIKVGTITIGTIVILQYLLGYGSTRLSGMFNPNTFGDLATLLTLFSIVNVKVESYKEFSFSLVALSFGVTAIVMANSLGATLSFGILLFMYALLMHVFMPHNRMRSWIAVLVGIIAFASIFSSIGMMQKRIDTAQIHAQQWKEGNDSRSSVGVRLEMYTLGLEAFKDSPWIGYGYYNANVVASRYANEDAREKIAGYSHLHNEFLTNMVSAGVIGLVALLLLFGVPLVVFIRAFEQESTFAYAMMGVLLVIGYAVLGMTHGMLEWEYENSFFLFFLAYTMVSIIMYREN